MTAPAPRASVLALGKWDARFRGHDIVLYGLILWGSILCRSIFCRMAENGIFQNINGVMPAKAGIPFPSRKRKPFVLSKGRRA
jgi:hypothetical protein